MAKKTIELTLLGKDVMRFTLAMKRLKFKHQKDYLRYCILHTSKDVATPLQRKIILKEMWELKESQKK